MTITLNEFLSKPFSAFGNDRVDHLGKAANIKSQAKAAIKAGKFDKAWELLHKQKEHYLKHAARCNFTFEQTIALQASIHADLANILRLEKRNAEALVHILYFVCASGASDNIRKKAIPYFNRAKLKAVAQSDIDALISLHIPNPDFRAIQTKIQVWANIQ